MLDEIAERMGLPQIALLGALLIGGPLAGTVWAQGIADLILVGVALVGGAGAGTLFARRRALEALPLELSRHAVRDEVDGVVVVKVRGRLGRGRVARDPVLEATWRVDGAEQALKAMLPVDVLCGAFTITVYDPHDLTARPGELVVRARVTGQGRTWTAEQRFTELRSGRFAAPVVRTRGRLQHDWDHWDAVVD